MLNPKTVVAGIVGLLAAGAAITAATLGSSSHAGAASPVPVTSATIHVATDTVNGRPVQILVDSNGMPLYTYAGDSATTSAVSGSLAALWPPLVSNAPTESGTAGRLTVVDDSNGAQVQYNGHFLYTFLSDSAGHATGQGVQNFFPATPSGAASPAPASPAPASPTYSSRY